MADEKKEKTKVKPVNMDVDRINKLLDVAQSAAVVRGPHVLSIANLALSELEQHSKAAQEELDAIAEELAAEAAKKAEEAKKEADALAKKEAEANKLSAGGGEVRRELPPLSPPPTR